MTEFHNYYAVLDVEAGCSFTEIRSSYKSLIQKWHPDRFTDDIEGQEQATERLQELNNAFHELQNYYKLHGHLPLTNYAENQSKIHGSMYVDDNVQDWEDPVQTTAKTYGYQEKSSQIKSNPRDINKFFVPSVTAVILLGSFWLYIDEPEPGYAYREIKLNSIESPIKDDKEKTPEKNKIPENKNVTISPQFFTYGASIGEVISIQGPPDNIKGNIWLYGKSEIHFKDGQVVKWIHSLDKPLRARIDLGKDNLQNEDKPGN